MFKKFKIAVPSFNSIDYLGKTLASIERQTYSDYDVCVVDDCSSLREQREVITDFCQRNSWKSVFHKQNYGALHSIVTAISSLHCDDDDVVVLVDGDDWLYDEYVLEKLAQIYSTNDIFLTWGQFQTYPKGALHVLYAAPIPDSVIEHQMYREMPDIFLHLRTFKYCLFRHIRDKDLRDPATGDYFRVSGDKALFYPMLEMAGHKVHYVDEVLYVYNIDNPLNDFKINRKEQKAATVFIKSLPKYPTLEG